MSDSASGSTAIPVTVVSPTPNPSTSTSTVASSHISNDSTQLIKEDELKNSSNSTPNGHTKASPISSPLSPPASSPSTTNSSHNLIDISTATSPPTSGSSVELPKSLSLGAYISRSSTPENDKPKVNQTTDSSDTHYRASSPYPKMKEESSNELPTKSVSNASDGFTTGAKTVKHDVISSEFYDSLATSSVKKQKTHEESSSNDSSTIPGYITLGSNLREPSLRADSPLLKPGMNPPSTSHASNLPKHQIKFALAALRAIKRLKDSGPFLHPVDALKLNVPTYYDTVKRPMDISTMEKKLQTGAYNKISDFGLDMELIVYNCCLFNGADSFISNMARSIKSSFEKHMGNMPLYEMPGSVFTNSNSSSAGAAAVTKKKKLATSNHNNHNNSLPPPTGMNKKPSSVVSGRSAISSQGISDNKSATSNTPVSALPPLLSSTVTTPVESSPAFALTPSGIPMIRRDSSVDGRPKREIHPPKSKDLPYSDIRPRKKKYAGELKFCSQVLKELMSKKYEAVSFPFLVPVDPVALNCPTYYKIIKHPMDLSTISDKINSNQYETADEFEADIRLMFKNCYKFNPAGSPVNDMGAELEAAFDKRWLERPARPVTPPPTNYYYSDDESSEFDSDDEDAINAMTNPAIAFLEQQLERMKHDLYQMKKDAARELKRTRSQSRMKKRKKSISTGGDGKVDGRKKSFGASGAATPGRRRRSSANNSHDQQQPLTVTYEMKKELSEKIYNLSEKRIAHVISIIHESMPELKGGDDDEIELDMDQLDPKTVLKLYKYVVGKDDHKKLSGSGGGVRTAPNVSSNGSSNPNGGSPHRSPKNSKKKSKPLTEAEQARQIEEIQRKIQQFDKVKDHTTEDGQLMYLRDDGNASNDDEDDSGDDSDESSSEEE